MKRTFLLFASLMPVLTAKAATGEVYDIPYFDWYLGVLVLAAVVIAWAFYALFKLTRYLDSELTTARQKLNGTWVEPVPVMEVEPEPELTVKEERSLMDLLQKSVPIEHEAAITLDHNYDGIKELDNDLPPWWTGLFFVTSAFAVVYMVHFHVLKTGDSSAEKYEKAVLLAETQREERLALAGDELNASTVTLLADEASLKAGKDIFMQNCMTCHGAEGQGLAGAGPNFTDPYWIHGGAIGDLYTTIRYGVPAKGMISWKDQLPPKHIQQVASYILSLQGTNPAGALPPQGELYTPEAPASGDSAPAGGSDTTAVSPANEVSEAGL